MTQFGIWTTMLLLGAVIVVMGFVLTALFTKFEIPVLKKHQFGQFIREEGPQSHLSKQGTPTMGGVAIYFGVVVTAIISTLIFRGNMTDTLVILLAGLLFGGIGFLDDFIKVAKKHNLGLRAWQKLVLQILFSVLLALYVLHFTGQGTEVWIPFYGETVTFGVPLFVLFVTFVMVAMTNAVNLTDGLDGLCSSVTLVVALFFAVIGLYEGIVESAIACFSIMGACLGFLVFNHYPAKIFMGDTGSMALGALLTAAVVFTKMEFLIPIAGLIYVMEAASVIIQVLYFKATGGKRFFRMAPIHHHFELGGRTEVQVVRLFVLISAVCFILGLLIRLV